MDRFATELERLNTAVDEITSDLNERTRLAHQNQSTGKLTTSIRSKLNTLSTDISVLQSIDSSLRMTDQERTRREGLLLKLSNRRDQLLSLVKQVPGLEQGDFRTNNPKPKTWGAQETDRTRNLDNQAILNINSQIYQEQDKTLDSLSVTVGRQKQIGQEINKEIGKHVDILDDISIKVDHTTDNINRESSRIEQFSERHSVWVLWVIILVLVIAIILVLLV